MIFLKVFMGYGLPTRNCFFNIVLIPFVKTILAYSIENLGPSSPAEIPTGCVCKQRVEYGVFEKGCTLCFYLFPASKKLQFLMIST